MLDAILSQCITPEDLNTNAWVLLFLMVYGLVMVGWHIMRLLEWLGTVGFRLVAALGKKESQ